MEGECESSGELHLFPITSSPAMPILYVNSHSTWGALLRLVSRPLHHKKRAPPSNRCILFPPCSQWMGHIVSRNPSFPITASSTMPVSSTCTPSPYGVPFWIRQLDLFTVKRGQPKQFKACPLHFVIFPALNGPQHYMNSHPIWGALSYGWQASSPLKKAPPSNTNISCKHSFPTTSSYAMLVFHLPHSILVPHRPHSVLRDTHTHISLPFTLFHWPWGAHIFLFWRNSNHFSRPVVPSFLSLTWTPTPGRKRFTLPPLVTLMMHHRPSIISPASQHHQKPFIFTTKWPPLRSLPYLKPCLSAGFRDF